MEFNSKNRTKLFWLIVFSMAMGFMEAAVVVYLRKIYYPVGFKFPLNPFETSIGIIEFLREAATMIMLIAIGILTGKNTSQKFGIFILCFAVWDVFYYVFLKMLIDWPPSLFTFDILFIIPVPWVGPVLAPCLISLTMITFTLSVIYFQENGVDVHLKAKEWLLMIMGSIVLIISFIRDYMVYCHTTAVSGKDVMFRDLAHFTPTYYNWWAFTGGEALIIAGIISFIQRGRMIKNKTT